MTPTEMLRAALHKCLMCIELPAPELRDIALEDGFAALVATGGIPVSAADVFGSLDAIGEIARMCADGVGSPHAPPPNTNDEQR